MASKVTAVTEVVLTESSMEIPEAAAPEEVSSDQPDAGNQDSADELPSDQPDTGNQTVYHLGMVNTVQKSGSVWRIPVMTNETVVWYKVDTGAQVSILPRSEYRRLRQHSRLCP